MWVMVSNLGVHLGHTHTRARTSTVPVRPLAHNLLAVHALQLHGSIPPTRLTHTPPQPKLSLHERRGYPPTGNGMCSTRPVQSLQSFVLLGSLCKQPRLYCHKPHTQRKQPVAPTAYTRTRTGPREGVRVSHCSTTSRRVPGSALLTAAPTHHAKRVVCPLQLRVSVAL